MNVSKSATSLIFAANDDGTILPLCVVYKATNIYDIWTLRGLAKARYSCTKSGWFDVQCFINWLTSIALPHLKNFQKKSFNWRQLKLTSTSRSN